MSNNKHHEHKTVAKAMTVCIDYGVTVYPIYNKNNRTINKKKHIANNWYIEVDNNGTKQIYNKSIGIGSVLGIKSKSRKTKNSTNVEWSVAIEKVWIYWENLIIKHIENQNNGTNKRNNNN